jgi:hypothetical protein
MTKALIYLLDCVAKGEEARFDKAFDDVSDRIVQADWIRHLMLGLLWPVELHLQLKEKSSAHQIPECGGSIPLGPPGLRLCGAEIVGALDLKGCGSSQAQLPALSLMRCHFTFDGGSKPTIDLSGSFLCGLFLEGSRLRHLRGVGMTVSGSVNLSGVRPLGDDDKSPCWCKLSLCTINGNLSADRAQMRDPESKSNGKSESGDFPEQNRALNIYGSRIGGSILLRNQPLLDGGLLLDSARVAGDVLLDGGEVTSFSDGSAIAMARARIDGSLTIKALQCRGLLWLDLCEVGGSLDIGGTYLVGAYLDNARISAALYAKGLSVRGWLTLSEVIADRPLCLQDAQIGGNLRVLTVTVKPSDPVEPGPDSIKEGGLVASGMRVAGTIELGPNEFAGGLNLIDARCATLQDERSSYGKTGRILIDGFRYERLDDNSKLEDRDKILRDRLDWWLPKGKNSEGKNLYRPQPYVQFSQILANHGQDALVLDVLDRKAREDARQNWKEKPRAKSTGIWLKSPFETARWVGLQVLYWFCILPYGFLFRFGLSPGRAVTTVLGFIVIGSFMFGGMRNQGALVVAQTPVANLVHVVKDNNRDNYRFASTSVKAVVPVEGHGPVIGPSLVKVPASVLVPVPALPLGSASVSVERLAPVKDPAHEKKQIQVPELSVEEKREQSDVFDSDVPCNDTISLPVYAADVFIPLVDLREEGKCEIDKDKVKGKSLSDKRILLYRLLKAAYAIIGWLVTAAAIVTVSGVMRHRLLRD